VNPTTPPGRWADLIAACGGIKQTAKRLKVASSQVYRWARGMHYPSPPMIDRIVKLARRVNVASPLEEIPW
jgi:hypothetical protein